MNYISAEYGSFSYHATIHFLTQLCVVITDSRASSSSSAIRYYPLCRALAMVRLYASNVTEKCVQADKRARQREAYNIEESFNC